MEVRSHLRGRLVGRSTRPGLVRIVAPTTRLIAGVGLALLLGIAMAQSASGQSPSPGPSAPVGAAPVPSGPAPSQVPSPLPSPGAGASAAPLPSGEPVGRPAPTPIVHPGDGKKNTCYDCHSAISAKQQAVTAAWKDSAHGKAGVSCADCHGGDPGSDSMATSMSASAGFIGKPDRTQTVAVCASCHSDPERMKPYGLSTDQWAKYQTSVHGERLLQQRDTRVAICSDCHGSHDVKKASDPTAKVYPLNVPQLCASCHSNASMMQPYGIPTNQFDIYKASVHGQALLVKQDLRAPSCASCHGSHDAKPPQSSEVVNVCGKCHTATQGLYQESRHAQLDVGPKCWTCHGTHDVAKTSEARFFHPSPPEIDCATCHNPGDQSLRLRADRFTSDADRRCDTCHHERSDVYAQAQAIHDALNKADAAFTAAQDKIAQAAAMGMIVTDADMTLTEARTNLIQARAAVHTTKLTSVAPLANSSLAKASQAAAFANAQLDESTFRRQAMVVVVGLILANVLALLVVRRRLERRGEASRPTGADPWG